MARPKEFEREDALACAVHVFANHGYGGTSTDMLLQAMGISRQSMYDTFGDKRKLYLAALQHYAIDSISGQIRALDAPASPLKGLAALLEHLIAQALLDPEPKCLGVASICEFGRSDVEINMVNDISQKTLQSALERRLLEARDKGEMADIEPKTASLFVLSNMIGIKVAARAGVGAQQLREIAGLTLRGLTESLG